MKAPVIRRRPLPLPAAVLVALAGTAASILTIAWAIRTALNVG